MNLIAFDTNILVYAVDQRAPDSRRLVAQDMINRAVRTRTGILSIQALVEFYSVVTRKGQETPAVAANHVALWGRLLPVVSPTLPDITAAMQANRDHGLSIWDAMIWAVARRAGAALLLSEDFQDGRVLEGVRFVNPFNPANADLLAEALPLVDNKSTWG